MQTANSSTRPSRPFLLSYASILLGALTLISPDTARAISQKLTLRLHSQIEESFEITNIEWGIGPQERIDRDQDHGSYLKLDIDFFIDPEAFSNPNYGNLRHYDDGSCTYYPIRQSHSSRLGYWFDYEGETVAKVTAGIFEYYGFGDDSLSMEGDYTTLRLDLISGMGRFTISDPLTRAGIPWRHQYSGRIFDYEVLGFDFRAANLKVLHNAGETGSTLGLLSIVIAIGIVRRRLGAKPR